MALHFLNEAASQCLYRYLVQVFGDEKIAWKTTGEITKRTKNLGTHTLFSTEPERGGGLLKASTEKVKPPRRFLDSHRNHNARI